MIGPGLVVVVECLQLAQKVEGERCHSRRRYRRPYLTLATFELVELDCLRRHLRPRCHRRSRLTWLMPEDRGCSRRRPRRRAAGGAGPSCTWLRCQQGLC